MSSAEAVPSSALAAGQAVLRTLAVEIGARRPTSAAEQRAAAAVAASFGEAGCAVREEEFRGIDTFAYAQAVPLLLAAARPGPLAPVLGALEADLRVHLLTRLLSRRRSRNVVASLDPSGRVQRTLCVVSHLDTSRSGLLFDPRLAPHLRKLTTAASVVVAASALAPLLRRRRAGRAALGWLRLSAAASLGLLAERELRGVDVPGANDNASGVAASVALAHAFAAERLDSTRIVFLATGCEESGTIGMRSFLEANDTEGWLFLNLDGVAAPATLRYLPREGVGRTYDADPALLEIARDIERERPELGLKPAGRLVGLTYDATPVLARGGRALTVSAQDDVIPNYHEPSDTLENLELDVFERAVAVAAAFARAIDAGAADR